jgi:hypothetical protein
MLAGGVGVLGEAAGGGRLARIAKLGEAADRSIEALHTGETVESAAKAARLATKAAEAGDASRAANLDAIAKTLAEKETLQAAGAGTKLEKVTAAAKSTSKLGAHVAGGPAEVYVKGAGLVAKGLKAIPGVEEAAAHIGEAVRGSGLMEARRASKLIKEASSEHLTGEQARLNGGIVHSMKGALKAAGKDSTTEAAAILRHTGSADALAKLADLPDEHLAPLLEQHVGPGFTPEALRLAINPTPEVEAAQAKFGEAVASHEGHFVKQYGNKADLSEAALANRAHGVEHPLEPLPLALGEGDGPTHRRHRPPPRRRRGRGRRHPPAQPGAAAGRADPGGAEADRPRRGDGQVHPPPGGEGRGPQRQGRQGGRGREGPGRRPRQQPDRQHRRQGPGDNARAGPAP